MVVLLHLDFFASRAELVALAILSPVIWLGLCCPVGRLNICTRGTTRPPGRVTPISPKWIVMPAESERGRGSRAPGQFVRKASGAICPDRERCGTRRRSWPSSPTARRTLRMESAVSGSAGSPRERQDTSRVCRTLSRHASTELRNSSPRPGLRPSYQM